MTGEMATERRISVVIVDDHQIFAEVLAMRLERESLVAVVTVCSSLAEARAVVPRIHPDVVVLDYDVAGEVGTALIEELRHLPFPPQVVMLSASDDAQVIIEALSAGASAWVSKGARAEVLITAANEVLQGRMYLYPSTVRPVVERLLSESRHDREASFADDLPERQLQVLRCLVSGMTRAEAGTRLFITANTVRTHVQHLLGAADVHSTLALVARARDLGVTGIDDPDGARGTPSSR